MREWSLHNAERLCLLINDFSKNTWPSYNVRKSIWSTSSLVITASESSVWVKYKQELTGDNTNYQARQSEINHFFLKKIFYYATKWETHEFIKNFTNDQKVTSHLFSWQSPCSSLDSKREVLLHVETTLWTEKNGEYYKQNHAPMLINIQIGKNVGARSVCGLHMCTYINERERERDLGCL